MKEFQSYCTLEAYTENVLTRVIYTWKLLVPFNFFEQNLNNDDRSSSNSSNDINLL